MSVVIGTEFNAITKERTREGTGKVSEPIHQADTMIFIKTCQRLTLKNMEISFKLRINETENSHTDSSTVN